jgi:Stage II sporulation protein E (SpoIIE)
MPSDGTPDRTSKPNVDLREWSEQLPDVGDAVRVEFGPEAATRFSEELFRFQRKRAFIYAVVMALFLSPFFVIDLWSAMESIGSTSEGVEPRGDSSLALLGPSEVTDVVMDGILILFHAVFAAIFQRIRSSREILMKTFLGLLIGTGSCIVLYVWWATRAGDVLSPTERGTWLEPFVFGGTAIFCAGFAHLFASFFVALSPREALIPVIPVTLAYILTMLTLVNGPSVAKVWMIAAWPLAAAPGLLWCTWRYRKFVDSFRWQVLRTRLGDLRQDLADARRVHEALLPAPMLDGAVRFHFGYEPMRDIGGDYLFARRHADGSLTVVLADVVGHGVAAALAANRIHGELERLFDDSPEARPGEVMALLNRFIFRSLAPQGIFATAIALHGSQQRVSWSSAGHPAALLLHADGRTEHLAATAVMLGVVDSASFSAGEAERPLGRGDAVIVCTDGVHEAAAADGTFFGDSQLMRVIGDARVGGPDRVVPAIVEAVRRYRAGEVTDDVLVAALWRHA